MSLTTPPRLTRLAQTLTLLALLIGVNLTMRADTFRVNAALNSGTLSGVLEINTTTGIITSEDITMKYNGVSYLFNSYGPNSGVVCEGTFCFPGDNHYVSIFNDTTNMTQILLGVIPTTLVGFTGSPLCSIANGGNCNGYGSDFYIGSVDDRVVTGAVAATPEPSSVCLFATGLLAMAFVYRRRLLQGTDDKAMSFTNLA